MKRRKKPRCGEPYFTMTHYPVICKRVKGHRGDHDARPKGLQDRLPRYQKAKYVDWARRGFTA